MIKGALWHSLSSSPPSATYMRQWIGSALVQIMACRLCGAKPFYLNQCWVIVNWNLGNKLQWNLNQNDSQKCIWKYCLRNGVHFVQGRWGKDKKSHRKYSWPLIHNMCSKIALSKLLLHLDSQGPMSQINDIQLLGVIMWWPGNRKSQDLCKYAINPMSAECSGFYVGNFTTLTPEHTCIYYYHKKKHDIKIIIFWFKFHWSLF